MARRVVACLALVGLCVVVTNGLGTSSDADLVTGIDDGNLQPEQLGERALAAQAPPSKDNFVALRSDDYDVDNGDQPEYHIRHLGESIVLTTLSGYHDKKNGAWIMRDPLCPPGEGQCPAAPEGSSGCFSFEAADAAGSYIAKLPQTDDVGLKAWPFGDVEMATFCALPGTSNEAHVTYESLGKAGYFLTHVQFALQLCNNEADSKCGIHTNFERMSTFEQLPALYMGVCSKTSDGAGTCECIENFVGRSCDLECPAGCGEGECTANEAGDEAFCQCTPGVVGPICNMHCPLNPTTGLPCGAAGGDACAMVDNAPQCQCGIGFKGPACEYHCPDYVENGANSTVCGGRGECVMVDDLENIPLGARATKCNCEDGYVGGACQLACNLGTTGEPCGGERGTCTLNDEAGTGECECAHGFSGDACQFDCPVDAAGLVCSGHGTCAEQAGGTMPPVCTCEQGFAGDACQAECPGMLVGTPCSGHGRCVFTQSPAPVTDGTEATEPTPEEAAQNIVDDEISSEIDENDTTDSEYGYGGDKKKKKTSSRKLLDDGAEETPAEESDSYGATCVCSEGFGGAGCEKTCLRDGNGEICGGHGVCTDQGECECEAGFVGPSCTGVCPGVSDTGDEPCSGNGECKWNPVSETTECECNDGFLGTSCSYGCPRGGSDGLQVCSGKGQCLMQRGTATCICEDGIMGKACNLHCPGAEEQSVCNEHGFCRENPTLSTAECTCHKGYMGAGCKTACPGIGEDGSVCSGRGQCQAGETKDDPATCECQPGFMGGGCDVKCPTDEFGNICSGAGKCELRTNPDGVESAECVCYPGRVNYNCDTACPMNTADGTVCSGHGECDIRQKTDSYGDVRLQAFCQCADNFLGNDCMLKCPTAEGNSISCSGHGLCELEGGAALCKCSSGWSGDDCNERVCNSMKSFFNADIGKCTCETGFTCCSREGSSADKERDAAIEMLQQENKLMMGKIQTMKKQLATMVEEEAA